jgi:hypothetical protein
MPDLLLSLLFSLSQRKMNIIKERPYVININSVDLVRERTIATDRLSAKLVPTSADRECCMVHAVDPKGCILGFLDRSCYIFFPVAPQLYL